MILLRMEWNGELFVLVPLSFLIIVISNFVKSV